MDRYPYLPDFVAALNHIHDHPGQANGIAEKGYEWAVARTWENAAIAVERVLEEVMQKRGKK